MAKKPVDEVVDDDPNRTDGPVAMPYTLYFPRVGDTIEYIDAQTISHRYRVIDVVHTFQDSPSAQSAETIRLLRSGLPAVYLARDRRKPRNR
jgi:hypothetical protein